MKQLTASLWEIGEHPDREELPTAVLFPFAGGSAYSMPEWAAEFAPAWRTLVVQYPGRGPRHGGPFPTSLRELGDTAAEELLSLGTAAPLLIGHSMGALVAHRAAVELEHRGVTPSLLLASAALAPHVGRPQDDPAVLSDLSDDELVDALRSRGGFPDEALEDRSLLAVFLPAIRSDLALVRAHLTVQDDTTVSCPVLAIGGTGDEVVPVSAVDHWARLTTAGFARREYPGDHFFFRAGLPGLAEQVAALIGPVRKVARL